jgi:hypothetical protein
MYPSVSHSKVEIDLDLSALPLFARIGMEVTGVALPHDAFVKAMASQFWWPCAQGGSRQFMLDVWPVWVGHLNPCISPAQQQVSVVFWSDCDHARCWR